MGGEGFGVHTLLISYLIKNDKPISCISEKLIIFYNFRCMNWISPKHILDRISDNVELSEQAINMERKFSKLLKSFYVLL